MTGGDTLDELVLTPTDAFLIADVVGRLGVAALVCPTSDRHCVEIAASADAAILAEVALPPAGLSG